MDPTESAPPPSASGPPEGVAGALRELISVMRTTVESLEQRDERMHHRLSAIDNKLDALEVPAPAGLPPSVGASLEALYSRFTDIEARLDSAERREELAATQLELVASQISSLGPALAADLERLQSLDVSGPISAAFASMRDDLLARLEAQPPTAADGAAAPPPVIEFPEIPTPPSAEEIRQSLALHFEELARQISTLDGSLRAALDEALARRANSIELIRAEAETLRAEVVDRLRAMADQVADVRLRIHDLQRDPDQRDQMAQIAKDLVELRSQPGVGEELVALRRAVDRVGRLLGG